MNPNDVKGKSINAIMLCNPNEPYNKAMGVTYRLMEVQTLLDHPKANWYFIYWANYVGLRWCVRKHDPPPHQMTEKQMQRLQEYGLLHSNEAISQSEEDAATDRKKLGREPTIAPRTGEKRADPMPTTKWAGADTRWITLVTTAVKEGQQCAWHNEYRGRLVIAHVAGVSPHPQHFLAFNCYMDFTMASATDPTEAGFREFWRDFHKRLMASELRALRAAGKLGGGQKVALAAEGIPSPYWAEDMQDGYLALHICGSTG